MPGYGDPMPPYGVSQQGRGNNFRPLVDRRRSGGLPTLDLQAIAPKMGETVAAAVAAGLGILLSPTSDGGALSVTVYDGDDRMRSYGASHDELVELLDAVTDHASARMVGAAPTRPTKRAR